MSLALMGKLILIAALLRIGWELPDIINEFINGFIKGFKNARSTSRKG